MDLKVLGQALGINIVNKEDSNGNAGQLNFDLYSKLSLETAELKKTSKKNIPTNPHPLGKSLFIKVNDKDKDLSYYCSPSDKVLWLKENICKDLNLGMEECTLIYRAKILKDENTLSFYKIRNIYSTKVINEGDVIGGYKYF